MVLSCFFFLNKLNFVGVLLIMSVDRPRSVMALGRNSINGVMALGRKFA